MNPKSPTLLLSHQPRVALLIGLLSIAAILNTPEDSLGKPKEIFKTHPIVPEKELLITDPAVVDSGIAIYPGALSFGYLMEQLAGTDDPSDFVRGWLESWEIDQKINGHVVAARKDFAALITDPWQARDGFAGEPRTDWKVDLANAPFRLLAVVNRIDMGGVIQLSDGDASFGNGSFGFTSVPEYYGDSDQSGGEFRLVFGATDPGGEPLEGGFTVIFEYSLPNLISAGSSTSSRSAALAFVGLPEPSAADETLESRLDVARYAARWHALGAFEDFDESYLQHLSELAAECTDRKAGKDGKAATAPPLAQLRTNEGAFDEVQEAREFDYREDYLVPSPVAATPDVSFAQDPEAERGLTRFINQNDDIILTSLHRVPAKVRDPRDPRKQVPFLAGSALMPKLDGEEQASSFFWDAERVRKPEALRLFSLNTCSGCHCAETDTEFYHIAPRRHGEASRLSKYLRMDSSEFEIDPPNGRGRKVEFNEMVQRAVIFEALLDPYLSERDIRRILRKRTRSSH
ncbi:MAG: hypothetical protein ACR2RV_15380 [Verrucomicrobiales bacterium]